MSNKKVEYLNSLVASYGVFYTKLHQHHWYVQGPAFFTLHEMFEGLYNEVTGQLDEVAERVLQIKGEPVSTLKEFIELSLIDEAVYSKTSALDMIKSIKKDYETLNKAYQEGFDLFDGDEVTTDLLVGLQASAQKHIWMLDAYLA